MSDALSNFISGLQSLNPNDLGAAENKAAFAKFQGLDGNTQKAVLNDLTGKFGTSFDELNGLSEADKIKVTDNIKNGRGTFDGVNRQQSQQTQQQPAQQQAEPKNFEQAWVQARDTQPSEDPQAAYLRGHGEYAQRHGVEQARNRHGYTSPERAKQLDRINAIHAEAARDGKSFGDVADAWVREGRYPQQPPHMLNK